MPQIRLRCSSPSPASSPAMHDPGTDMVVPPQWATRPSPPLELWHASTDHPVVVVVPWKRRKFPNREVARVSIGISVDPGRSASGGQKPRGPRDLDHCRDRGDRLYVVAGGVSGARSGSHARQRLSATPYLDRCGVVWCTSVSGSFPTSSTAAWRRRMGMIPINRGKSPPLRPPSRTLSQDRFVVAGLRWVGGLTQRQ